ncbi:MAG: RAMP superfamily CRISPR-associated protein, partial [Candidatus Poribacteria bacterium]|nr:RAMP superfamily CRISPR-associated protein [Candidatus Poribacteria bacterium]
MENTTTTSTSTDNDVVVRRLYARGKWKLDSVAHFGSHETGVADMCLLQDANGKPFIPGASVAGAARSFLARKCLIWTQYKEGLATEPRELKDFFGGADKEDTMSPLIVSDAACVSEKVNRTIRDGVSINIKSGTAKTGAKYDVEVAERGTEFELCLVCIIRSGDDIDGIKDGATKPNLEDMFSALLRAFQDGDIRLGARTRRGYGRGKVESWEIRDLQMDNQEDVMAWLRDDPWSQPNSDLEPEPLQTDQRCYFRIEADFELRSSLLIRSVSGEPEDPDMVHLQSDGKPVIPGTSFAGAFRQRATLIANTIGFPEKAVEKMFGFVHKKNSNNSQEPTSQASRVLIEERLVKNVEMRWQHRVAIDRFTGGSLQSALFDEKPVYPLSLKEPEPNIRLRLAL